MQKTTTKTAAAKDSGFFSVTSTKPDGGAAQTSNTPKDILLTKRERDVLELMAFGLSNKEIAQRLGLGRRTVETHIDHVLSKLNAPTRTRAVVEASRAGLLTDRTSDATSPRDEPPNNLPFALTPLVGRETDLAEAQTLLFNNRLVTLSGSGGVGKTRLALRVGVDLLHSYSNGVWFCDFSPIVEAGLAASVVAKVLSIREQQGRPLIDTIVHVLKGRRALTILDNCEHVLDTAAELTDEILHQCPNIRILATSRQALGIVGEVVQRVPSLALPNKTEGLTVDRATRYGAIALFVDRAQAADTRFAFDKEAVPHVVEICQRLDGIPLALELAATRVSAVALPKLAKSLDDRFAILTAGSRTAFPRHKTLAALIDWSYGLLLPAEQRLFARLGIFAGGFSVEAATAVCSDVPTSGESVSDLLFALVDKSLVTVTSGRLERYGLLESTRAFALEKLKENGDWDIAARRRSEYFLAQAQAADARYGIGSTAQWLADIDGDLENYRATLEWALTESHDVALGASVAGMLERLWALGGLSVEARLWLGKGIESLNEAHHPAARAPPCGPNSP